MFRSASKATDLSARSSSIRGETRDEEKNVGARGWEGFAYESRWSAMRRIPVFDFVLTCRHYGIRFGQPPVEKAPSWSWISITVVMATAIDSTGVRAVEENGENDRARPRDAAQGYSRWRERARESDQPTEMGNRGRGEGERERKRVGGPGEGPNAAGLQREDQRRDRQRAWCYYGGATRYSLYPIQFRLNSTGQFYGVGLEIRRSFEAGTAHPFPGFPFHPPALSHRQCS